MVESTQGDGVVRRVMYAKWREEPAEPGYSKELINIDTPKEYFDDLDNLPLYKSKPYTTLVGCFEDHVKKRPNEPWLATRAKNNDGSYG